MNDFRNLLVWQKAHEFVLRIYQETKCFPREEIFGVTSQLRRCASSVAANIAEGNGRSTRKDYLHFLVVARGSLNETRYFVLLSTDLGYLATDVRDEMESHLDRISKLLAGLIRSLEQESL